MESNEEVLNLKFKICDEIRYEINKDGIVTVFEKQNHKIQQLFRKLNFKIPLYKEIVFDEISSTVFLHIDGNKTVENIGEILKLKYGDKIDPVYERLLIFLKSYLLLCKHLSQLILRGELLCLVLLLFFSLKM